MSLIELVLVIIEKLRPRRSVLASIAGVSCGIVAVAFFLHVLSAAQTHIGLPSLTALGMNLLWPAAAAIVLFLIWRSLPRQLWRVARYFALGSRPHALWMGAIGLVAGCTLWAWLHPESRRAQTLPSLSMVPGVVLLGALISYRSEASSADVYASAETHEAPRVPAWARSMTNSIVAGAAVSMALLVWGIMSRLPVAAGGLRDRCVQVEVSTVGMPAPARKALVGAAAARRKSPGREMTLPARILRKNGREAFLWLSTGQGITVPVERIGIILDYEEDTAGCGRNSV